VAAAEAAAKAQREREESEFEKLQKLYEKQQRAMFNQVGNLQQLVKPLPPPQEQFEAPRQSDAQFTTADTTQPAEQQPKAPTAVQVPLQQQQQQQKQQIQLQQQQQQQAAAQPIISPGQIFVCTNRWCREKGADATMATFSFLSGSIPVVPVNCLGRCNKGPNVRIFTAESAFIEASMVRSVETVVSLLQEHMHLTVNVTSAEVLRLNYEGNVFLREGEVDQAIECYNKALALGDKEQEGVLLVMRGSALLQRAYACRLRYKDIMSYAEEVLPSIDAIRGILDATVLSLTAPLPSTLVPAVSLDYFKSRLALEYLLQQSGVYRTGAAVAARVAAAAAAAAATSATSSASASAGITKEPTPPPTPTTVPVLDDVLAAAGAPLSGKELLKKASLAHSMYEFALMRALEDLLTATVVLPGFAQAWRRAGDALGELQHFSSAVEYYEVAARLDSSLAEALVPAISRLKVIDSIVSSASEKGWSKALIQTLIEDVR
jgi:tetratricopeptide (TPR) repeat protein